MNPQEQRGADAAFIVRAVNAHDELVAALADLHRPHLTRNVFGYQEERPADCATCSLITKVSAPAAAASAGSARPTPTEEA